MRKTSTLLFLTSLAASNVAGQVVINEIMQSNVYEVYHHEGGKFPQSWIELYNPTDKTIRIRDYALGESRDYSEAKKFEKLWNIPAQSYITLHCDDEVGYKNVEMSLNYDGGKLYLFDETGTVIDSLSYPEIKAQNVSYGKDVETGKFGMMLRSTPGEKNTKTSNKLPKEVKFSADGGTWEHIDPFYVELTSGGVPNYYAENRTVDPSLCIRYTLDGSEPNDSSLIYNEPIYIDTTKIIKAKVFDATRPLITAQVQSYISLGRKVTLPTVSIVTEDSILYGQERGLLVWEKITDRRVPMNIEIRYGDTLSINQLVQSRIQGASSARITPQKSLAVYAKKRLGEKRFKGVLWKEKPKVAKNKSIILRTGGGRYNGLQITDAWAQRCMGLYANVDYQAHTPAIAFINGKYFGRVNIRERSNKDYAFANYNDDDVEVCKIFNKGDVEITSGDGSLYERLIYFCDEPHTLKEWEKVANIDNMIDSYITYFWFSATDVQNNGLMWRSTKPDGKWNFIIKDLDKICYKFADKGYLEWLKKQDISKCLFNALQDKDFLDLFLNRFIAYHGDFLNHDKCMNLLYQMYDEVKEETEGYHNPRWGFNPNIDSIMTSISNYLVEKGAKSHSYLSDYFGIGKPVDINIDGYEHFSYDDIPMHFGSFHGKDFEGRKFVLKASELSKTSDLAWNVKVTYNNGESSGFREFGKDFNYEIPLGVKQIDINIEEICHGCPTEEYKTDYKDVPMSNDTETGTNSVIYDQLGRGVASDKIEPSRIYLKKDGGEVKKFMVK